MANTPQSAKRSQQSEKRRCHNVGLRSRVRTAIKAVRLQISTGNAMAATTSLRSAFSIVDRMANKGIISKNKAARNKSKLARKVKLVALGSTDNAVASQE